MTLPFSTHVVCEHVRGMRGENKLVSPQAIDYVCAKGGEVSSSTLADFLSGVVPLHVQDLLMRLSGALRYRV